MRTSALIVAGFGNTPRPEDIAKLRLKDLAARAGVVRYAERPSGFFDLLPLGNTFVRSCRRWLEDRAESRGIQGIYPAAIQDRGLLKASGRLDDLEDEILSLAPPYASYVLAPAHEEYVTDLVRNLGLRSARSLPLSLFISQPVIRAKRHRSSKGLAWTSEIPGFGVYDLSLDDAGARRRLAEFTTLCEELFTALGLPVQTYWRDADTVESAYDSTEGRESFGLCSAGHRQQEGERCFVCELPVRTIRNLGLAMYFIAGDRYARALDWQVEGAAGRSYPILSTGGIGLTRVLYAAVEVHRDAYGLRWPPGWEPYSCAVLALHPRHPDAAGVAERLYRVLRARGVRVLLDDRNKIGGRTRSLHFIGVRRLLIVDDDGTVTLADQGAAPVPGLTPEAAASECAPHALHTTVADGAAESS